ncbi:restriction endonuclease subunit S [Acinetobacter sp. YH12251]|uniref:restriction endonuclease subunit S n=1 Tax=Acinetobacter sp. YH12251 TaxID=2601176 RepID=UPI00211DB377|nr:restriction endonuclease subunit S [Acinetobacter sp. YH12251]
MFEKYDAYKDSGVEWIGEIPSDWEMISLKRSIDGCFNGLWGSDPKANHDDIVVLRVADFNRNKLVIDNSKLTFRNIKKSEIGNRLLKKGDLLIEKSGGGDKTLVGCVVLFNEDYKALTSNFVAKMTPKINVNSYFLNYFFATLYANNINYQSIKQTTGIQNLDTNSYLNEKLVLPSLYEQEAIVNFLNQKASEIDQAIAIKEQQIALLNERKQIVIQKAVTQGLDPNVPMKDSGVEWIGQIPEHWEVIRSKFLFTQRKENSKKDDVQLSATQAYGVIPQEEYEKRTGKSVVKISLHLDKRKRVHLNDFVISMRSFQGGLERAWAEGCIRSSYVVLKPLKPIDPDYYGYLFKTPMYIKALQNTSNFIRDGQDLNFGNFSQVDLFIVPLSEQKQIVEYIKSQLGDFEKHLELLNQQIEKLKEYKTTLINDAVTGKIKVA